MAAAASGAAARDRVLDIRKRLPATILVSSSGENEVVVNKFYVMVLIALLCAYFPVNLLLL